MSDWQVGSTGLICLRQALADSRIPLIDAMGVFDLAGPSTADVSELMHCVSGSTIIGTLAATWQQVLSSRSGASNQYESLSSDLFD